MTDLAIFLGFLAAWFAVSIPAALIVAGMFPRRENNSQALARHLADRPRAFRQNGFDNHHGEQS